MLPLQITNRLALGRDLAVEVVSRRPGSKAWVYVWPVVSLPDAWERAGSPGSEPRLRGAEKEAICGYGVRYVEIDEKYHSPIMDIDYAVDDPHTVDEVEFVKTLPDLEEAIARYTRAFDQLRPPATVLYPRLPMRS